MVFLRWQRQQKPTLITSQSNPKLKLVRKLSSSAGRKRQGCYLLEGEDLVEAAMSGGAAFRFVLIDSTRSSGESAGLIERLRSSGVEILPVEGELLDELSQLGHHSRLMAVLDLPKSQDRSVDGAETSEPALYLDGLKDPGNIGTVLRSAQAFGCRNILLGKGCADPYSLKALRASAGAMFGLRIVTEVDSDSAWFSGRELVVLDGASSVSISDNPPSHNSIICVGSERDGVSQQICDRADSIVSIPMEAGESLNAGVAASIALWEMFRKSRAQNSA